MMRTSIALGIATAFIVFGIFCIISVPTMDHELQQMQRIEQKLDMLLERIPPNPKPE